MKILQLRNISIGVKVSLGTVVALLGLLLVAAIGWVGNRQLADDMARVGGEGVQRLVQQQALDSRVTDINRQLFQSLTWEAIGQRAEQIKALDDALTAQLKATSQALTEAAAQAAPADKAARQEIATTFAAYAKSVVDTLDMKSAGVANASAFVPTLEGQYKKLHELLDAQVRNEVQAAAASVEASKAAVTRRGWISAFIAAVVFAVAAGLSWLFMRAIVKPLSRAAALAKALAQGDLTVRHGTQGRDATGEVLAALDGVARNLTGMVGDIRNTAAEIDVASGEIAVGNADLSSRTEGTAASLQQAAASIEELTATVRQSAENAQHANVLARDASGVAREGGAMVADVVLTMDQINAQAKKIGEIIATIDGIAFQTNILALNAAVEAARAGEQGRGFSVVAGEVRLLAQRSAEASREIRTLISSSVEQIDGGARKVQSAGATMQRIVQSIEQVAGTVEGIARAAAEQAGGIAQVNQTVSEMERATQQNAAMVEQASAATESLRHQSQRLVSLLERFRVA